MINFAVIGTNFITDRFLEAASTVPEFCLPDDGTGTGLCRQTWSRADF